PTHPYGVARHMKVGKKIAPAIVVSHDADELRGQVSLLRDHPDARFGAVRARHDSADIVGVDRDRLASERAAAETHRQETRCGQTHVWYRSVTSGRNLGIIPSLAHVQGSC